MAKMYGLMRLGRDAEVRITPNGKQVANLSLVYNYGQKDGDEYPSQWIDAAFWGERADKLAQYLTKGSQHLFTLSDVHIEKYTDKDGYEACKLAGRVDDVELGPKKSEAAQDQPAQRRPALGSAPTTTSAPPQATAATQRQAPAPRGSTGSGFEDMDDSIPF